MVVSSADPPQRGIAILGGWGGGHQWGWSWHDHPAPARRPPPARRSSDCRVFNSGFAPSGPCIHPKNPISGFCIRGLPHRGHVFAPAGRPEFPAGISIFVFLPKWPKMAPQGPGGPWGLYFAISCAIFGLFLGPLGGPGGALPPPPPIFLKGLIGPISP